MASVTCPICGHDIQQSEVLCPNCRSPRPRFAAAVTPPPNADEIDQPNGAASGFAAPETACDHADNPPGRLICLRCGAPISVRRPRGPLRVGFPWGVVAVPPETQLEIGREVGPLADRLSPYGKVSRRHATLRWHKGSLLMRDEHSTNGTYINGTRLQPGTEVELLLGDEVGFSSQVTAHVVGEGS